MYSMYLQKLLEEYKRAHRVNVEITLAVNDVECGNDVRMSAGFYWKWIRNNFR